MKDANGFFHISPCMEGRGIESQAKKPKAITANRKINHSTTIFRFAVKIRGGKGKRRALRHLHFPPSFKTNLKLPKASLTTSNGVSRRVLCTIHFIFLSRERQLSVPSEYPFPNTSPSSSNDKVWSSFCTNFSKNKSTRGDASKDL